MKGSESFKSIRLGFLMCSLPKQQASTLIDEFVVIVFVVFVACSTVKFVCESNCEFGERFRVQSWPGGWPVPGEVVDN